jgi:hypothetical protein
VAKNHRIVRWCTRLSGEPSAPAFSTRRRTRRSREFTDGTAAKIHRTVRCAPDYLVCTRLSGEPTTSAANGRQRDQRATRGPSQQSLGRTRQCLVLQGYRRSNGRLRQKRKEIGHQTRTVHVWWCTGLSGAPPDRRQELPSKWNSKGS